MSDLQNIMARFRQAIEKIKSRLEEAEKRPAQEELTALLNERQADLEAFKVIQDELVELRDRAEK